MRLQKKTKEVNRPKTTKREFSSGGVVVRKKGRSFVVLLIKDGYGRWTWPKGNINRGESSKDAAVREIEEEVGIKEIAVIKKIGQTQYFYKLKSDLIFKTVFLYLCETKQARLKIQESEIEDGKWFAPADALKKIEYKGSGNLLKKALKAFSAM
jgi:8-oxo-dGTP diphosphatase